MRKLKRLPPLKKRERPFESRLRDELKKHGVMFVKIKPTRRGLPDRLAMGFSNILLAEIKREGEDPDEAQREMHAEIRHLTGRHVMIIRGPDVRRQTGFVVNALRSWR